VSGGFQPDGFQGPPGFQQAVDIAAEVTQSLPSLTQAAEGFVDTVVVEEGPGGGIFLGPGFMHRPVVRARIDQTLPALTQSVTVDVNDDELVLLLILA